MTDEQMREFYELCQRYRHCPVDGKESVLLAYQELLNFVNPLAEKAWKYDDLNK